MSEWLKIVRYRLPYLTLPCGFSENALHFRSTYFTFYLFPQPPVIWGGRRER